MRTFHQQLRGDVDRASPRRQPLSVLLVDLDDLRRMKGDQGLEAGDEALRVTAEIVREHAGAGAEPAWLGGAALAVALADRSLDAASTLGDAILVELALRGLSASIGIAELSSRVATPEALVRAAEAACGEAKRAGTGRVVGFRGTREG